MTCLGAIKSQTRQNLTSNCQAENSLTATELAFAVATTNSILNLRETTTIRNENRYEALTYITFMSYKIYKDVTVFGHDLQKLIMKWKIA